MNYKRKMQMLILLSLLLMLIEHHFSIKSHLQKMYACWNDEVEEPQLSAWFNSKIRPDVITTTDWLAPVIWEGTYNRQVLENYYKKLNITIGLVVFASGQFVDHMKKFLQSADKHFMVGFNVIFYIFFDGKTTLPYIELSPLRTLKIFPLVKENIEQDISIRTMRNLGKHLVDIIQHEVDFLFIMDVNQIFKNDFGVETLGRSVAQLHAWWYFRTIIEFPYERRHKSAAFIPFGQGDFYYHRAIFGGTPKEILIFIKHCLRGIKNDTTHKINSLYESHLNKYFFVNKPTKLLSPEYNWDPKFKTPPQIKHINIAWQSEII
ncbi:N-acetyllactosaminide alpha-1,3-galactosyltransferase-like 1 [Perognathus longimembris pacificus]|uniref:N-acetyllactosaminide alpha-1,3-galactosyltransferase-like 1 n=1 Tax=Perognathus longimembris pacificus TaxID=214514 RepID=UPI0020196D72|nr:N-acetyllactosaminide alpha-1,3-galactosyltransferase-like 1 [Perognathus longimembris pacificus]